MNVYRIGRAAVASVAAVVGSAIVVGTAVAAEPDVLAGVRAAWESAMLRGDAESAAAVFTPDATQLRPGRPTNAGRAAIAAGYREDFAAALVSAVRMSPSSTRVSADSALQHGTFRITWLERTPGAKPLELHGRFLLSARRVAGEWRIALEMHTIEPDVPEDRLR
jgi:uncharacterized protein (TIGR02246 family)